MVVVVVVVIIVVVIALVKGTCLRLSLTNLERTPRGKKSTKMD